MSDKVLVAEQRTELGTADSKRLRREGKIPAVIYGKKHENTHIAIDAKMFEKTITNIKESGLMTISVGKKKHSVLIKNFQDNPISGILRHIDFYEVTKGEVLHTQVAVVLLNAHTAAGVKLGGLLEQVLHEVVIECLPKDIPEHIEIDVKGLGLNESLNVASIQTPAGVKILTTPDHTIVTITAHRSETASASNEEVEEAATKE